MRFSDIPSHEEVKEQLRSLVDADRLPHALLLEGRPGIGKMMMARALAQYIHCTRRSAGDSCGVCPACRQHQSFNHIDTHFVFPVVRLKSGSRPPLSDDYIEQWRNFLTESPFMDFNLWQATLGSDNAQPAIYVGESSALLRKLSLTAHAAKYMVAIIWLPEKMNEECANKLLKIIEEPHSDTRFILVSNESAKILPTIYSRLQRINMRRLPDSEVAAWLMANHPVDPATAVSLAHLSEGSILEAKRRIQAGDSTSKMLEHFVTLMRMAYKRDIAALKKWTLAVADLKREPLLKFLEYCERLVGENYIYNLRNPGLVYLDRDEERFSVNFARFINERNVEDLRNLFVEARRDIAGNANAKIVMFDVAVKAIMLIKR